MTGRGRIASITFIGLIGVFGPLADAAPVEEHLLVCEECRVRLAEWDGYIRAMREAMRQAALNRR